MPLAPILQSRLVPVVVIDDAAKAAPLARALLAGGLPVIEITLRTAAGLDAIRAAAAVPGMLVGAGTVLTAGQAEQAVAAGARYLVSPGLSATVVRRSQELGVPVLPGVCTPTEIMAALDLGVQRLKFFPAGNYGGVKTLKSLSAVFPQVSWMPTGGIDAANLKDYLALKTVAACGGSWMCPGEAIAAGDWSRITALTAEAVALAH